MTPTSITAKRGNTSNIHKHLTTQHTNNLDQCNTFDMLACDDGDSQGRVNENPMRINKELNQ